MIKNDLEDKLNKIIGGKLYEFRKENSINKKEICNILNISQQQLSKYENGVNRISCSKLFVFLLKYNINSEYFFSSDSKMKNMSELFYNFSKFRNKDVKNSILNLIKIVISEEKINNY